MTAEPSVRDRVAEVLAGHHDLTERYHADASCSCGWVDSRGWVNTSRRYGTHQADALAAAGLLAGEAS